jgi:predicted small lipoprotein YifL
MSRSLKLVTVLLCATLAVSACGKRGLLEAPAGDDGQPVAGQRKYLKGDDTKGKKKAPPETEHREFILDGLLR